MYVTYKEDGTLEYRACCNFHADDCCILQFDPKTDTVWVGTTETNWFGFQCELSMKSMGKGIQLVVGVAMHGYYLTRFFEELSELIAGTRKSARLCDFDQVIDIFFFRHNNHVVLDGTLDSIRMASDIDIDTNLPFYGARTLFSGIKVSLESCEELLAEIEKFINSNDFDVSNPFEYG